MRRIILVVLIAPYALWHWPRWAAHDLSVVILRGAASLPRRYLNLAQTRPDHEA